MSQEKAKKQMQVATGIEIKQTREYTSKRLYSNFVSVSRSQFDISLTFCDVQAPILKPGKQPPTSIDAPVQVEIVIPIALLEPLMDSRNRVRDMGEAINEAIKE